MKQSLYLAQLVIMMVLFAGITSYALSLEKNNEEEKGKKASIAVQALAFIGCKGNKACMNKKIKIAKCSLSKFSISAIHATVDKFKKALKKNDQKGIKAANDVFKKLMAPIVKCNITPKNLKVAFAKGLKMPKSKKAAKKHAKKAKKVVKKVKKAKKAKKAAKKAPKKAAKKAPKKAAKKAPKKAAKKAPKKAAKKAPKKAAKKVAAKKAAKKVAAKKAAKKAPKKAAMTVKALANAILALVKLC